MDHRSILPKREEKAKEKPWATEKKEQCRKKDKEIIICPGPVKSRFKNLLDRYRLLRDDAGARTKAYRPERSK